MPKEGTSQKYSNEGAFGCLARVYWMLLGNVVILFAAILITQNKSKSFLVEADWVFFCGVFSIILFRYLDIAHFKGERAEGQMATMADFSKYLRNVLIVSAVIWSAAHALKFVLA